MNDLSVIIRQNREVTKRDLLESLGLPPVYKPLAPHSDAGTGLGQGITVLQSFAGTSLLDVWGQILGVQDLEEIVIAQRDGTAINHAYAKVRNDPAADPQGILPGVELTPTPTHRYLRINDRAFVGAISWLAVKTEIDPSDFDPRKWVGTEHRKLISRWSGL